MAHLSKIFKQQPVDIPNRSGMDLSFENILSMTTGTLIPVLVEEVLPNETYSLGYMCEAQLPPMATEFYGRIDMRLEAFFVPNRILWAGWQDFMTMPVYNPVFRVHEVGKHTVGEFRRDDLQKGNCAKLAAHLKHSPVAKSERGRRDKVFDRKTACG